MRAGCYVSGRNRLGEGGLRERCLFFQFKMKTPTKFCTHQPLKCGWNMNICSHKNKRRRGRVGMDEWMDRLEKENREFASVCIHILLSLCWHMLYLLDHPQLIWRGLFSPFKTDPHKLPWIRNLQNTWGITETYTVPMSAPKRQWRSSPASRRIRFPLWGEN